MVTLQLEAFDVETRSWKDPLEVLSISIDKLASGAYHDAFLATGLKGLDGKFVVKRYRSAELVQHFQSLDAHTRKVVQMHALARHFSLLLCHDAPLEFSDTFLYTKLYYAEMKGEFVTVESYIGRKFQKICE
jgi:hypothetical protein